ncbi:PREDICTED: carboxypeptidase B-like [Thamnophis sirtalis]|uniref:Carboxypeptidase B-like n=1 Tax=Thamnophis sirtalis TaxID=35019 RepID=A0A6I9X000_9SAUR|nr:PREDICTED: carboxypeptidase B-like [Thamnophis sirtalis]
MWLLLLFIGASSAFAEATVQRFDGEKVYRVTPRNEDEVHALNYLANIMQIDFWYPDSALHIVKQMEVDFHVSAAQSKIVERLLKQNGIPYQIVFDNLQEDIEKQLDGDKNDGHSYEKYNEWDKISDWTARIAKSNPTLVSRIQIGKTFENRSIFLLQNRFWRKNRSNASRSNCIGVDINRNFDVAWSTADSSRNPCEETYCGSAPESEPETKAVASFIRSHLSSIKGYLTMHSYSQMILFPFGYTYEKTANYKELNELAKRAVKAIASLYGKEYNYGTSASTIYLSSGCSDDWVFNQGINYSFTFELRDKGKYGFLLPESQIKPTCQEIMLAVKLIASYILNKTL